MDKDGLTTHHSVLRGQRHPRSVRNHRADPSGRGKLPRKTVEVNGLFELFSSAKTDPFPGLFGGGRNLARTAGFAFSLGELNNRILGDEHVVSDLDATKATLRTILVNTSPPNVKQLASQVDRNKLPLRVGSGLHLAEQIPHASKLGLLAPGQGFHKRKFDDSRIKHGGNIAGNRGGVNTFRAIPK
jgi:hypothetical protein